MSTTFDTKDINSRQKNLLNCLAKDYEDLLIKIKLLNDSRYRALSITDLEHSFNMLRNHEREKG